MKKYALTNCAALAALLFSIAPAQAADHLDAPGLTPPGGNAATDITDIYAFQSPDCSECTVLVMAVNALTPAGLDAPLEHKRTAYVIDIDNDGDAKEDVTFVIRASKVRKNGQQKLVVRRNGHPDGKRTTVLRRGKGRTTVLGEDLVINNGKDGVKVFAGMVDDAFYFDLPSFFDLSFCSTDPAPDTFAGSNVTAIALEVPNALLLNGSADIGVWASVWNKGKQVDRMGRPGINTVLIPSNPINGADSRKNEFNAGTPRTDREQFGDTVIQTLGLLGNDAATSATFAGILLPDILTINVDQPSGYLNGRTPADDVIDASLNLLTGGAIPSDCVDGNDVPLSDSFPYFGAAHLE